MGTPSRRRPRARHADLNIDADLGFQYRMWRFERVGWAAILLVLTAGGLGFFGGGWLSREIVTDAGTGATVRYDRIVRRGLPFEVRLDAPRPAGATGHIDIGLSPSLASAWSIDRYAPEPESVQSAGAGWVLRYPVRQDAATIRIDFGVTADTAGNIEGWIQPPGAPARIFIRQFVLP